MSLLLFNKGGNAAITVTATNDPATDLVVTISLGGSRSASFTTAGGADATATATAFVAAHAQALADTYGIIATSAAAVVTLSGIGELSVSATGASGVTFDATSELSFGVEHIVSTAVASATSITVNLDAAASPAASDVVTLLFASEADRKKFVGEMQDIVRRSERGQGVIEFGVAARATAA